MSEERSIDKTQQDMTEQAERMEFTREHAGPDSDEPPAADERG